MSAPRLQLADELLRRLAAALRAGQLYSRGHPIIARNLEALSAAGYGDTAVVATACGRSKGRMESLWLLPGSVTRPVPPPGAERADETRTLALRALLGPGGQARVFVQEKLVSDPKAPARIVCWVVPAQSGLLSR